MACNSVLLNTFLVLSIYLLITFSDAAIMDRRPKSDTVQLTQTQTQTQTDLEVSDEDVDSGLVKNVASFGANVVKTGATQVQNSVDPETTQSIKNGETSVKEIFNTGVQSTINEAAGIQETGSDDLSWAYDIMATGEVLTNIISGVNGFDTSEGISYSGIEGGSVLGGTSEATQELISQMEINCAWQVSAGKDLVSSAFSDDNIYTHVQVIPNLLTESVVWVQGQFPKARQFSFSTYDIQLDGTFTEIKTLTDKDITPRTGINPFADSKAQNVVDTEFDIYLTGTGSKGYPNEMGYRLNNGESITSGKTLVLVYRIIAPTNDEKLSLTNDRSFGYIPPPIIRSKLTGIWKGGLWAMLEQCPSSNVALVKQFNEANNAEIAAKTSIEVNCPTQNNPNNFVYLRGENGKTNPGTFSNEDSNYLLSCGSKYGEEPLSDLTMIVEGTLPITADGLFTDEDKKDLIQIANTDDYDARYVSISIANLLPPRQTYVSVAADKIERFYTDKLGEGEVWDRNYRLVFTSALTYERSCGSNLDTNVTAMPIVYTPASDYAGVIYREAGGNQDKEYTVASTKQECLKLGRCSDPREISRLMGGLEISHNICSRGEINNADAVPTPEWTPYPTPAPTTGPTPEPTAAPPTPAPTPAFFFEENWEEGECAGLAHVDLASATEYEVFVNGVNIGSSDRAGTADLRYGWYPIEETPEEVVVAIKAPANHIAGGLSGILADVELCGHRHGTDMNWKCSDMEPTDLSWTDAGFDDSAWMNPKLSKSTEICEEIGCDHLYKIPKTAIWPESCDGKRVRNAYCRVSIPSECTTCQAVDFARGAVSLPKQFGTCVNPDILNVVTKISSAASYDLFVNGKLIAFKPTDNEKAHTFQSIVSSMTDNVVVAIEASYLREDENQKNIALLAEIDICGYTTTSDMNWKCTEERPESSAWYNNNFDDSKWSDAAIVSGLNRDETSSDKIDGISENAYWIWSGQNEKIETNKNRRNLAYKSDEVTSAFCRVVIPSPVKAASM